MSDVSAETAAPVRARRARVDAPSAPMPSPRSEPAPAPVEALAPSAPAIIPSTAPGSEPPVLERPANFVRQPFAGVRYKLDNTPRPGFFRRWFNDDRNRIIDAQRAGYTFVLDQNGAKVKYTAGTMERGGGLVAYYMEIPLEWYEADQATKLQAREAKMNQIRHGIVGEMVPGQDGAYRPMNKAGTIGADIRVGNRVK